MAGVTRDQIIAAAEALKSEGIEPSYRLVRARLGTGSYTTIARVLQDWQREAAAPAREIPDAFVRLGEEFLQRVWTVARSWASAQIAVVQAEAEVRVREAEQSAHHALATSEELQAEVDQVTDELARYKQVGQDAIERARTSEAEARGALEEVRYRNAELTREVERLRKAVAAVEAAHEAEELMRARGQDPSSTAAGRTTSSGGRRRKPTPVEDPPTDHPS